MSIAPNINFAYKDGAQIFLNDFESFDRFLFGSDEPDWGKFLDEDRAFISPITNLENIVHYQLCHYAYWMTIAKNKVYIKPRICNGFLFILDSCYACQYARWYSNLWSEHAPPIICEYCPLSVDKDAKSHCGDEYYNFRSSLNSCSRSYWAEKVAKMTWREKTE